MVQTVIHKIDKQQSLLYNIETTLLVISYILLMKYSEKHEKRESLFLMPATSLTVHINYTSEKTYVTKFG